MLVTKLPPETFQRRVSVKHRENSILEASFPYAVKAVFWHPTLESHALQHKLRALAAICRQPARKKCFRKHRLANLSAAPDRSRHCWEPHMQTLQDITHSSTYPVNIAIHQTTKQQCTEFYGQCLPVDPLEKAGLEALPMTLLCHGCRGGVK